MYEVSRETANKVFFITILIVIGIIMGTMFIVNRALLSKKKFDDRTKANESIKKAVSPSPRLNK